MSGLSWLVVLRKRPAFREAFGDFDPAVVGRFGARDVGRLMNDAGIVRNRAKIEATINNARRFADVASEFGSFAAYVWTFATKPRRGLVTYQELMSVKASGEAVQLSKDLRRRGWAFVGPTTVYSFMQAMGLVNDHVRGCAAGLECLRERRSFSPPARV